MMIKGERNGLIVEIYILFFPDLTGLYITPEIFGKIYTPFTANCNGILR